MKGWRESQSGLQQSPDELDGLVLVVVVPAVAELDQLLVGELKVPHDAGTRWCLQISLNFHY